MDTSKGSNWLTPCLTEPRISIFHSQGPSNNSYPQPNQSLLIDTYLFKVYSILYSHLLLGLPKGLFLVVLPLEILKVLLPSFILVTCPFHLNVLDLIILTILGERYRLWTSSLWSLLRSPFLSPWAQIFASGSCFQIPLAWIPPLM